MNARREQANERSALRLLSCSQMGSADQAAIAAGVSGLELMENAGRAVAEAASDMISGGGRTVILCGPGNNGGDGFVAARYLAGRGCDVAVGLLGARDSLKGDAGEMARRYDGEVHRFSIELLDEADLVIDAVFGAGLNRPIGRNTEIGQMLNMIVARGLPVLAVDVPSGLSGDTAEVGGAALVAERTVTFFRRKPGHLLWPGRDYCGDVVVAEIGIPDQVLDEPNVAEPRTWANAPNLFLDHMEEPTADVHKYRRGHTVVVSGGIEMSGAARLAARAALRIGSGMVTVASPPDAALAHASQLNSILLTVGQDAEQLKVLFGDRRKNCAVIGPGLGLDGGLMARVLTVLESGAAAVLDADALTGASKQPERLFEAIGANSGRPVVLTPHEGEFSRLFGGLAGSKLERARTAAQRSGSTVVLKGPDTVIAARDGRAAINENAPAYLATAGSGDVLSGMIGGLLARQVPAFEAACAAVWMHGDAGRRLGPGLISEDLVETLPAVLGGWSA